LTAAVECTIAAEPIPASDEKAARLNPCTRTPIKPPAAAVGAKASWKIRDMASGTAEAFTASIQSEASK